MLKINLDDIDSYKEFAVKAKGALRSAKNRLTSAASLMESRAIDSESLSIHNPEYDYAAMDKRRKDIVTKINTQASNIDTLIGLLDGVDTDCDSYYENVETDEEEIIKLLGNFISEDYGKVEVEDFVRNEDIMTFDAINCDYYVNKDGVKIYVNIPHGKFGEERYKILDVGNGSFIKKLYDYNDQFSVVLLKNNKDGRIRIGYIENENMNPTFSSKDGERGDSNLQDRFTSSSGYGIVKNDKVVVRPFPNSDQGEDTANKYHSRDTYMAELKSGTRVKVVGEWLGDEQDARKSYLVAFNSDSGNFMGFVSGDDLETGIGNHSYDLNDVTPVVTNKETNLYCIDNVKRVAPQGFEFKYKDQNDGGIIVSFNEDDNEILAYINPNDVDMIVPDSLSKIGYGN